MQPPPDEDAALRGVVITHDGNRLTAVYHLVLAEDRHRRRVRRSRNGTGYRSRDSDRGGGGGQDSSGVKSLASSLIVRD